MVVKVMAKVIWITDSIEQLINQSVDRLIIRRNVSLYLIGPHVSTVLRNAGCVTVPPGTHTAHCVNGLPSVLWLSKLVNFTPLVGRRHLTSDRVIGMSHFHLRFRLRMRWIRMITNGKLRSESILVMWMRLCFLKRILNRGNRLVHYFHLGPWICLSFGQQFNYSISNLRVWINSAL